MQAVGSSNPARVTIKIRLARKATGNHLIKSTFLEKARGLVSGFCYAPNRVCDAVFLSKIHNRDTYLAGFIFAQIKTSLMRNSVRALRSPSTNPSVTMNKDQKVKVKSEVNSKGQRSFL